jgi:hypothetical protein
MSYLGLFELLWDRRHGVKFKEGKVGRNDVLILQEEKTEFEVNFNEKS